MTMARAHLVDPAVTRWYHCVRRAFLLGEGEHDRKAWIENRIRELAEIFAVSVAGFAILDNHLHLLIRLDPHVADAWSDEEVAQRWGRLHPPRDKTGQPLPVSAQWVAERLANPGFIATARQRLQGLGWFMKCLKEPLARLANGNPKKDRHFSLASQGLQGRIDQPGRIRGWFSTEQFGTRKHGLLASTVREPAFGYDSVYATGQKTR